MYLLFYMSCSVAEDNAKVQRLSLKTIRYCNRIPVFIILIFYYGNIGIKKELITAENYLCLSL